MPSAQVFAEIGSAATGNVSVVTRTVGLTLAILAPSSGTLSPAFTSGTLAYMLNAGTSNSNAITATPNDAAAIIKVNGVQTAAGVPSAAIPLALGSNSISAVVSAPNSTETQTYTITATRVAGLPQTITFPVIGDRLLTNPTVALMATSTSGLSVTYKVDSGPASLSGSSLTLTGEGPVTVSASQAGDFSYAPATSVIQSFNATKAAQTVTFPSIGDRLLNNPTVTLAATASSGLAVTYAVVSGPVAISGSTLTLIGEGVVTVSASQAGSFGYSAASASQSFKVSKAAQTITFPSISNRLRSSNSSIQLTANSSSGLPISYSIASGPATVSGSTLTVTGTGSITVLASQEGSGVYLPAADVPVSFTVYPNTGPPAALSLSKSWFYDNTALNTLIGTVTAVDPDIGDTISYSLVAGSGSTDNAKFSLSGNSLRTKATFNYDTKRSASIRLRATDSAGQFTEQILILKILPASPNARFIQAGSAFTLPVDPDLGNKSLPYVNAIFQLVGKNTGRGYNYPRTFFDPSSPDYQPDLFQAFEGATPTSSTTPIAYNESYFQVGKISDVPSKVRTVLLLDCSSSISLADLTLIKSAAKGMVDKMFEEQEIAVYSFSGSTTKIQDFIGKTDENQVALKAAIDTIARGSATTNLYGSMLEMLSLPKWKESFTVDGIETGFLVVLTDGADSSGSATKEQVIASRDNIVNQGSELQRVRRIYTIGLGAGIETQVLQELQNTEFYIPASQASALAAAFDDIQSDIIDLANSFYQFNYISPKRVSNPPGTSRKLEVKLNNNTNSASDRLLNTKFNSDSFTDLAPAMYINRTVSNVTGINSPKPLKIKNPNLAETASAITLFPPLDFSSFTWRIGNPSLATLSPQGANGERVIITPNGLDGTTTLTLTDTISNFTKTIPLIIGTGVDPIAQSITFGPLPDLGTKSAPFTLTASASSSLPVVFSLISGPATLSGNRVTLTGATGTVVIRASQAGNDTYAAAVFDRSFNVVLLNEAPTAIPASITTSEDTAVNITLAGTDPESSPLTYSVVTQPKKGVLTGTAPNLTYKPNANYSGTDSFTFLVNDGKVNSTNASVTLNVTPVNDTPVANAVTAITVKNTLVPITMTGSDPEGSALTFSVVAPPANGTLSGSPPNLSYTPNTGYTGTDSFTFIANDGPVNSIPATVSIQILAANEPPVATPSSISAAEDTTMKITLAGTDPEGSPLTYSVATQPVKGTLTGTAPNLTYKPNANFNGTDSFTFRVNDGITNSATATVSLKITAVNDAPVATAKSVTTKKNTSVAITLTGSDVEGSTLKYSVVKAPANGTLSGTAPKLTYKPKTGYTGADSFTFRVNDGTVNSATATVKITVTAALAPQLAMTAQPTQTLNKTTVPDPYFAWSSGFFSVPDLADPTISGDNADPDHDGLPNLLEFLLGGDPTDSGNTPKPALSVNSVAGGQTLVYRYNRKISAADMAQVIEHAADLSSEWTPAVHGQNGVTITTTLVDTTTEQVTVTIPSTGSSRFIRLKATR